MALAPEIVRVNKHKDRHGKLSSVEYFYKLNYKQRSLLVSVFANSKWNSSDLLGYTDMIRRILRTGEYSENDQVSLSDIRSWYISNK